MIAPSGTVMLNMLADRNLILIITTLLFKARIVKDNICESILGDL